jgi:hypothetical protein
MNYLRQIGISALTSAFLLAAVYYFMPLEPLMLLDENSEMLGSTITEISGSDKIKDSRAVINTNFSNLNTDKLENSAYYATTTHANIASLPSLSSVGTITTGTWNGTTLSVAKGGTGATTLGANLLLLGNGTGAVQSVTAGSNDQILKLVGGVPTWDSATVDETLDYDWTGVHDFASTTIFTGYVSGAGFTNIEVKTASGIWAVPTWVQKIRVRVVGGGGNGGANSGNEGVGGGGGAGGYCEKIIDVTATSSIKYVVGAAGQASNFSTYCTANAGSAGNYAGGAAPLGAGGGDGGTATGGDINITGGNGGAGIIFSTSGTTDYRLIGAGGASILGSGPSLRYYTGTGVTNGASAVNYGAGGGGAGASQATAHTTGAGAQGVVIIEY